MDNKQAMVRRRLGALPLVAARLESIWAVLRDRKRGWVYWTVLTLAVLYIVSPLDFIPDPVLILGQLDDLLVTLATAVLVIRRAENFYASIRERKEVEAELEAHVPKLGEPSAVPGLGTKGDEVPPLVTDIKSGAGSANVP